ncbi:MAG: hypothetical protein GQ583_06350, partial [Methyloprofundus sp.]|nr:hypothetical protein [Methyloprofundus sp.]
MLNHSEILLTSVKPKAHSLNRPAADKPLRILVLGNFSGHRQKTTGRKNDYRLIEKIDIDNFAYILAKIKPELHLSLDEELSNVSISFEDIDNFHPDVLLSKIDIFAQFSRIREKLSTPTTFKEAAKDLQKMLNNSNLEKHSENTDLAINTETDDDTLKRLFGESSAAKPAEKSEEPVLRYIRNLISDYIVEDITPFQDVYINAVDDAISALMRKILHHPDFQALEAAWRSVYMLISSIETDETLSVHLLDVDKQQLNQDLAIAASDLSVTGLFNHLVSQATGTYGEDPWSLIIGNFSFDNTDNDIALLTALGGIASFAGGPFIAAADPILIGCQQLTKQVNYRDWLEMDQASMLRWQALRKSAVAPWIGLLLPRIIMRLPYGLETDEIDSFQFEELTANEQHESLLWGNAAFYSAVLIAKTFMQQGWNMQLGEYMEITDLPAYIQRVDDVTKLQPCAEVCMNDQTVGKILERGIMPFISHRN